MRARIVGLGSYHPERCVTNRELAPLVGLDESGIFRRTGIRTRYWAEKDQATSDLAFEAARLALDRAGMGASDLDLLVVSTTSPDMFFPSTACLVQGRLGIRGAPAFDVSASCAGFLTALDIARRYLESGAARSALVAAAEIKSRFIDPHDPSTAILFGDGAGAAVLRAEAGDRGVITSRLWTDGSRASWIELPAGGSRRPSTLKTLEAGLHTMRMNGTAVFRAAVRSLAAATRAVLRDSKLDPSQIRHHLFHQANGRILAALARQLGLPDESLVVTLPEFGNTSSASLPMAWERIASSNRLSPGDLILLGAFGGGLNWGAAVVRW